MRRFRQFFEVQVAKDGLKRNISQVASALSSLVNPTGNGRKMMSDRIPAAHDSTEQFWSNPQFLQWLQSNGVQPPTNELPDYDQGGAGRAYFVGNHVVKFTNNQVEGKVAEMCAGRNDLPTPVIAVTQVGQGTYAILQHMVEMGDMLDKNVRDAADWLTLIVDEHPEMTGFPKDPREQEQLIRATLEPEGAPMNLMPYFKLVMGALAELYHGTGFKHDDAGPTNVGMHKGRVVFPDLGPNQTSDFSTDKALGQIATNRKSLGLGST